MWTIWTDMFTGCIFLSLNYVFRRVGRFQCVVLVVQVRSLVSWQFVISSLADSEFQGAKSLPLNFFALPSGVGDRQNGIDQFDGLVAVTCWLHIGVVAEPDGVNEYLVVPYLGAEGDQMVDGRFAVFNVDTSNLQCSTYDEFYI